MEKTKLTITVAGECASGKSRVTYLIKKLLKEHGFNIKQIGDSDFDSEEDFDIYMENNLSDAIKSISNKSDIEIKQIQINRDSSIKICE